MAKKSIIAREAKREKLVNQFAGKVSELKAKIKKMRKQADVDFEELIALQHKLASISNNARRERQVRRCKLTGRPHGNYRKFGMCRNMLRIYANLGHISGLKKSSW